MLKIKSIIFIIIFLFCITNILSQSELNEQCYNISKQSTYYDLIFNFSFCGGAIMDYNSTFINIDTNGDGSLSEDEFIPKCFQPFVNQIYCKYDSDVDGSLQEHEYKEFIRQNDATHMVGLVEDVDYPEFIVAGAWENRLLDHGYNIDKNVLDQHTDENGNVNTSDMLDLYRAGEGSGLSCVSPECNLPKTFHEIFLATDADSNNVISLSEFNECEIVKELRNMSIPPYDYNKDGVIQYGEWYIFLSGYIHVEEDRLKAESAETDYTDFYSYYSSYYDYPIEDERSESSYGYSDSDSYSDMITTSNNNIDEYHLFWDQEDGGRCGIHSNKFTFEKMTYNLSFCGKNPLEYEQTFDSLDVNNDGVIQKSEFPIVCFDNFVEKLFCIFDQNQDGLLDEGEFQNYVYSEDDFMYFSDPTLKDAPREVDLLQAKIFLNSRGISASDKTILKLTDETEMIPMQSLYDIVHSMTTNPIEGYTCNSNCDSLPLDISTRFTNIDTDSDGFINFEEFNSSSEMLNWRNLSSEQFDLNRNGIIEFDEWEMFLQGYVSNYKKGLEKFGINFDNLPDEFNFEMYDKDNDGYWNKEEFFDYLIHYGYERSSAWRYLPNGKISKSTVLKLHELLPNKIIKLFSNHVKDGVNYDPETISDRIDPLSVNV